MKDECKIILRQVRRTLQAPEGKEITQHADDIMHRIEIAEGDESILPLLTGIDVIYLLVKNNFKIAKKIFGEEPLGGGHYVWDRDVCEYPDISAWKANMIALIRGQLGPDEIVPETYIKQYLNK